MIFEIASDNPKFSYLLNKNPKNYFLRSLRKGFLFGRFISGERYQFYFEDGADENSYGDGDYEYLSKEQYYSSNLALNIITDGIRYNKEYDTSSKYILKISNLKCSVKTQDLLSNLFESYEFKPVFANYVELNVYYHGSFEEFIDKIQLFLLMVSIKNDDVPYLNESYVEKFCTLISKYNIPYYFRYLFKLKILKNKKLWESYSHLIQKDNETLVKGYLFDNRLSFAKQHIDESDSILDYGCGEGKYRLISKNYTGYDIDVDIIKRNQNKYDDYNWITEIPLNSFNCIILSEVIEHIDWEHVPFILETVVNLNPEKIIITTPNSEFNQFYSDDMDMRHDDHKWEKTPLEISNLLSQNLQNYTIKYYPIGDIVDGISPTQGYICVKN